MNPLKTFLYSPRMMNSCGLNFWQKKHCYVNSYYGKIGVEKFERELESTLIYNHIDAKIRINSLTPPLLLLLSKRSLLLPAATAYCSITYQKNLQNWCIRLRPNFEKWCRFYYLHYFSILPGLNPEKRFWNWKGF